MAIIPTAYNTYMAQGAAYPAPIQYKPLDKSILTSVTSNLGPGMANDPNQVGALQRALVAAGYLSQADFSAQGGAYNYGPKTTAAVAMWQKANNIPTSGNAGFFGPVSKSFISTGRAPSPNAPIIDGSNTKTNNTEVTDPVPVPFNLPGGNSGIGQMNEDQFNMVVPQLKEGTPEYEKAIEKINTTYYDVLQLQMDASTEQEQEAAKYAWNTLKSNIERTLNVKLSDDAFQAWDQVQTLKNQFGQQNIEGSGLQNEATDAYLKRMRKADEQSRITSGTDKEAKDMEYYTKFATPEQIKEFIASNPELAKQWGLVPSDEIRVSMKLSTLRRKYPNSTDEELKKYISQVLDENGNYRSNLYQRHEMGNSPLVNEGNATIVRDPVTGAVISETVSPTDIGVADIARAREQLLSDTIRNQNDAAVADYKRQTDSSTALKSSTEISEATAGPGSDKFASNVASNTVAPVPSTTTPTPTPTRTTNTISEPRITSNSASGGTQVSLTQTQINKLSPDLRKRLGY